MSLRRATSFMIVGSVYIVLEYLALHIFPSLIGSTTMAILRLIATFARLLFAYEFLRELSPRSRALRFSLLSIVVFTAAWMLMTANHAFDLLPHHVPTERGVFDVLGLLNSLALLAFLVSFVRVLRPGSSLRSPALTAAWARGLSSALQAVTVGVVAVPLLAGREIGPPSLVQALRAPAFLLAAGATLWFLIRFRQLEDYSELARR